jgi:hypothetical protein
MCQLWSPVACTIHELLGDDGQEYQTLYLRHHLGLDVHASVARGPRAPYKKREAGEINTPPPPPAIRARPPTVTDQASDLTPALQEANKANNTKTSSKLLGPLGQVIVYWEQRRLNPDHSRHRIRTTSHNKPARVFNSLSV